MTDKKYSYLPNSYTIKFFKLSNEEKQRSFKPLLLINNLKDKKHQFDTNPKEVSKLDKNSKNKSFFKEKALFSKKNNLIIEKRKKAINAYLDSKKKDSIKKNNKKHDLSVKYIQKKNVNYSSSSISKSISHNKNSIYHSFQHSKLRKKSNIISKIKNNEINNNKAKKKLNYSKTQNEFKVLKKDNKNKSYNIINNNIENNNNNIEKKVSKNNFILKSNSENKINNSKVPYKTTDKKKSKIIKIFKKDVSMKDNCFNNENRNKDNNIKVYKFSTMKKNNENDNKTQNKENSEQKVFTPNMNIFKDTKFITNSKNLKFQTEKNTIPEEPKINNQNNIIINNNTNYIVENINNNNYDNKDYNSLNNKNYENTNDKINVIINEDNNFVNSHITNKRPLNIPDINKTALNSELSQFTFKKDEQFIQNNQAPDLITEKRRNELKKLINFSNKFSY